MKVSLITIGDELLIGQITDTNSVFLAKELTQLGIEVHTILSISDTAQAIEMALERCISASDLVIITGGLGPTKDDVTKHTLCAYFDSTLVRDSDLLVHIQQIFEQKGKPNALNALNQQQADFPIKADKLWNAQGTACGMYFKKEKTQASADVISLPGVPSEMKGIFKEEVLPVLQKRTADKMHYSARFVNTVGIAESTLAEMLQSWELQKPSEIQLAYLPQLGSVQLRLSLRNQQSISLQSELLDRQVELLHQTIGDHIVSTTPDFSLSQYVGSILRKRKQTLSITESCTGGSISKAIVSQEGASQFYKGGLCAYTQDIKNKVLGISLDTIKKYGTTSPEITQEMSRAMHLIFQTDYALATTGNLSMQTKEGFANYGEFHVALSTPKGDFCSSFRVSQSRTENIDRATQIALSLLVKHL